MWNSQAAMAIIHRLLPLSLATMTGDAQGQTVQLPVLRVFSVNTAVSVPDGGSAFLGGNTRAYQRSQSRGLPLTGGFAQPRSFESGTQTTSGRVFARIIDLEAMDRSLLAQASAEYRKADDPRLAQTQATRTQLARTQLARTRRAQFLTAHIARSSQAPSPAPRGEDIASAHGRPTANDQKIRDVEHWLAMARAARAKGKHQAAATLFRMAKLERE